MKIVRTRLFPTPHHAFEYKLAPQLQATIDDFEAGIREVDEEGLISKVSKEKGKVGVLVHAPNLINERIADSLGQRGWHNYRFTPELHLTLGAGKQYIDFHKDRILAEVQLGKYPFVASDLSRFRYATEHGQCDLGILVVPDDSMRAMMSSGPDRFSNSIRTVGIMNYQSPLLVIGISTEAALREQARKEEQRSGRRAARRTSRRKAG